MVVDQITSVLAGLGVSVLGGALSAYMGWNTSNEPFDTRKFINGVISGIMAGLGVLMINIVTLKGINDEVELIGALITILLGALGGDRLRTDVSKTITKRADVTVAKNTDATLKTKNSVEDEDIT